eukprot:1142556-Pelagomonas_calceolata.AAC.1
MHGCRARTHTVLDGSWLARGGQEEYEHAVDRTPVDLIQQEEVSVCNAKPEARHAMYHPECPEDRHATHHGMLDKPCEKHGAPSIAAAIYPAPWAALAACAVALHDDRHGGMQLVGV